MILDKQAEACAKEAERLERFAAESEAYAKNCNARALAEPALAPDLKAKAIRARERALNYLMRASDYRRASRRGLN